MKLTTPAKGRGFWFDVAGNVATVSHDLFMFKDFDGWFASTGMENDANPILIGEELTYDATRIDADSPSLAPGEYFECLFIDKRLAGRLEYHTDDKSISGQVPPRSRTVATAPSDDSPLALAVTNADPPRVFERMLALDPGNGIRRVALVALGKVQEIAIIDVSNPANLSEIGCIPGSAIGDGDDTSIAPPFDFFEVSNDGRVAVVGLDERALSDDDKRNAIAVIDVIRAVGADTTVDCTDATVDWPSIVKRVGVDAMGMPNELVAPAAVVMLPEAMGMENHALIVPGRGLSDTPVTNDNVSRAMKLLDFGDFDNLRLGDVTALPMEGLFDGDGDGDPVVTPAVGTAANVGATLTADGRFLIVSQGPYWGYPNVIDLAGVQLVDIDGDGAVDLSGGTRKFPSPTLNPPPEAGPAKFEDGVHVKPTDAEADRQGIPLYEGPADIAVTRDATLVFLSNGLLRRPFVQALDLVPITSENSSALPVRARVKLLPFADADGDGEPDVTVGSDGNTEYQPDGNGDDVADIVLVSMGVELDRMDRYAFFANVVDHSVIAVPAAVEAAPPGGEIDLTAQGDYQALRFDLTTTDYQAIPVANSPHPNTTSELNNAELAAAAKARVDAGPFDLAVDPNNAFLLVTTNEGIFTLDITRLDDPAVGLVSLGPGAELKLDNASILGDPNEPPPADPDTGQPQPTPRNPTGIAIQP